MRTIEAGAAISKWGCVDLRELIGHDEVVPPDCSLEIVHRRFGSHGHEFMAVVDGSRPVGVCSRHDVGMVLGARYGFSLHSQKPVREFLSPPPLAVRVDQPIDAVLRTVFSRHDERFYDDVVLLDPEGAFLGLIPVCALVRLQARFLHENIGELQRQKQVIREKNRQMEDDLAMARDIQFAMLPREQILLPDSPSPAGANIHFARLYRPAQQIGGDFVHFLPLSDHSAAVFVSDVMGHGVRSALVTAMLRALVEELRAESADPGHVLTRLNRDLAAILHPADELMFATAIYLVADHSAGIVRYANAGHPAPFLVRQPGSSADILDGPRPVAGPGLCVFRDAVYQTGTATIRHGDQILLYTDGLIEAEDPEGELFGMDRLLEAVARHAGPSLQSLVNRVFAEVEDFAQGTELQDDVCLAALTMLPTHSQVPRTRPCHAV